MRADRLLSMLLLQVRRRLTARELADGYRTNLTGLNTPEVQALFLATPGKVLADLRTRT